MSIQNSIIAGRILSLLEFLKRSVTIEEIQNQLEEPLYNIKAGIDRLIIEGLAVLNPEKSMVRVELVKHVDPSFLNRKRIVR